MNTYDLKVKDYDENGRIVTIGKKQLYNLDGFNSASDWVREPIKGIKTFDFPQLSNAINIKQDGRGKLCVDSLGYMHNGGNNVGCNNQLVGIYSSCFSNGNGLSILPFNFHQIVSLFAARKLIESDWVIQQDQYMIPNTNHPDYQQFVNDAVVFSLFESKSQQSSLRNITYKDKNWNILNHFFFMSNEEMRTLANQHNFLELFNDTFNYPNDRFVYNYLNTITLSPDALHVLETARNLIRDSFSLRSHAHTFSPEYHLNAWDAGWYQIRNGILKDNFKDRLKSFNDDYKKLADRIRPLVYELGFLKS